MDAIIEVPEEAALSDVGDKTVEHKQRRLVTKDQKAGPAPSPCEYPCLVTASEPNTESVLSFVQVPADTKTRRGRQFVSILGFGQLVVAYSS